MTLPADELVKRLRDADRNSQQRVFGSRIFGEAADRIEAQAAELSSLRAKLAEAMEVVRPFNMQEVRLAVGEGKLRPIDVLNGVNAELKHRARRLIEENGK